MLLVHTVQGVDRRVEEGPGRGRIAVIGLVADPPGARQRQVGAHGRDPVGAASCVEKTLGVESSLSRPQIIHVQNLSVINHFSDHTHTHFTGTTLTASMIKTFFLMF